MASLKRDIASGLVVVGPLAITFLAIRFLFRAIAGLPFVARVQPWYLRVPVVLSLFVVVVLAIGYLMRTGIGAFVADVISRVINRIPALRVVYNGSQVAIETVLQRGETRVEPVRLDAWRGLRMTAFSTGHRTNDGRLICFLPTAPNITTGYVIEVEEEHIRRTGENVEDALTRILSAGFGEGSREMPPIEGGRPRGRVRGVRPARGEGGVGRPGD